MIGHIGRAIGYPIPQGTQFTPPNYPQRAYIPGDKYNNATQMTENLALAEPNSLYPPSSGEATTIRMLGPDGHLHVLYAEPRLTAYPFPLPSRVVDVPCEDLSDAQIANANADVVKQQGVAKQ